jgi:hypothetical protein
MGADAGSETPGNVFPTFGNKETGSSERGFQRPKSIFKSE